LRATNGAPAVRLGDGAGAALSRDGKWVAGTNSDGSQIEIFPTGPGSTRRIPCGRINCAFPALLPDGRVVFTGVEPGRGARIFVTPAETMNPRAISPEGVAFTTALAVSPDGKEVAALGVDAKPAIFPIDGGSPRPIPGTEVLDLPMRWTPDGAAIYVSRKQATGSVLSKVDLASGTRTVLREVHPGDPAGIQGVLRVYPTPDGRYYAYSYVRVLSTLFEVEGVR
ncbi:MAG TPA: hypothetical protein VFL12_12400, partial [Thermoanaerobaculia bacterium]|nr:hypothetical protein [Thermoanaerobaculia bacterium]